MTRFPTRGSLPATSYRETKRALGGVAGTHTQIWPGIDIDIPRKPITASGRRRPLRKPCWPHFAPGRLACCSLENTPK